MPLYDFKCSSCGKVITELLQYSVVRKWDQSICPNCFGGTLSRHYADNVVHCQIDGNFNTIDLGKKVSEKNNLLRKKWED